MRARGLRFRLLRRRLTISAPRMIIRSRMPWPLRWAGVAVVLGFCGAIGLWAFEFGKDIAGVPTGRDELVRLRAEVARLREQQQKSESIFNTSVAEVATEKSAQEGMAARLKALESENHALRDDLGFFENLIPVGGSAAIAIRALQARVIDGSKLKWQLLLIQPVKNAPEFQGRLEMSMSGTLNGKPWTMQLDGGAQPLQFRQYRRVEGMADLPPQAVVKTVSAKVVEGKATRALQSVRL